MSRFRHALMIAGTILLLGPTGAAAQEDIGFRSAEEYDTEGQEFSDAAVEGLIVELTGLLGRPEVASDIENASRIHFWRFFNRLSKGILSAEQTGRIAGYLESVKEGRSEAFAEQMDRNLFQLNNLMIGRTAPDIVGRDMDGVEFRLSDFRGKVVALYFTGHWCGPCRGEYPYQRLLLDALAEDPFVLLGVNSDDDRETAKQAKHEERLEYRMWWAGWDAGDSSATEGRIPTEWNVVGWPTIYILDANGVIRFRDERQEEVITAVKGLLSEMRRGAGE